MPTYTVCFCGTACSRDEGEVDREWTRTISTKMESVSKAAIYDRDTGYIPVRIHLDITGSLKDTAPSATVRGVGENDWADQMSTSDALYGFGEPAPLTIPEGLGEYIRSYSNGTNQRSKMAFGTGYSMVALALHGANLAAASRATAYNFLGHSRGAAASIMAAWFLYAYGGPSIRHIPINIFAIDPVPGPGQWYGTLTQLPPNVRNYVGVYAWDHIDQFFTALVPRPNFQMTQQGDHCKIEQRDLGGKWDIVADKSQLADPLMPSGEPQPEGYVLYACRGRHSTVAGNATSDGNYKPEMVSAEVAPVPRLVYRLARGYLTQWDTVFQTRCRVREDGRTLRAQIHTTHAELDAMAGGETRTARFDPTRPLARRVASTSGRDVTNKHVLEDVVGDPPYRLFYPCTSERRGGGWVKWKFL